MSVTEYVFRHETEYVLLSTAQLGPPGLPGAPGAKGSSATPGVEISEPYIGSDGNVTVDFVTHWGITEDGGPYFEPDPDDVPEEERALLDPFTMTISLGGPGRFDPPRVNIFGAWRPQALIHKNDLVGRSGTLYFATADFQSGESFDTTHLEVLA